MANGKPGPHTGATSSIRKPEADFEFTVLAWFAAVQPKGNGATASVLGCTVAEYFNLHK